MKKKLLIGLSSIGLAAGFWACGSGSVEPLNDETDGYVQALLESGAIAFTSQVTDAKKKCVDDPACESEMTRANNGQVDVETSTSIVPESSSGNTLPVSSSSKDFFRLSSMDGGDIGRQSSSSVYVPPVTTSSSGGEEQPTTGLGTCGTGVASVDQGAQVTWSVKWSSTVTSTDKFGKITYLWDLPDATPATGTAASAVVSYSSWGAKTASVSVSFESGKKGTIDCTPVNVNGAKISGCTCELATPKIELTEDPTATWIIKGTCASTAAITGYKWNGAVAADDGLSATFTYTKVKQTDAPTVEVTNAESTTLPLTCKAPQITDAANPETNITLKYSDTRTAFAGGTLYHVTYADNRGSLVCFGTGTVTCGSNAPVEVGQYGIKVGNFDECGTVDVSAGASIECANTW